MDIVLANRNHWYDCQTKPGKQTEWPGRMRCMLLGISFRHLNRHLLHGIILSIWNLYSIEYIIYIL